ncbi:MAG: hypothetical protein IKG96_09845 [Bacteroidaceae bacterium]|nr:hypothetical protein [Bacteroidaceae bacterium]
MNAEDFFRNPSFALHLGNIREGQDVDGPNFVRRRNKNGLWTKKISSADEIYFNCGLRPKVLTFGNKNEKLRFSFCIPLT